MDTDLHLLSRYHRQGDAGAFRTLVDAHAGMVHATARRVTQDAVLAQDVAQETFLALASSGGATVKCVGAWLHRVAWQKACNVVRSETRRHRQEQAAAEHLHDTDGETPWKDLEPVLDEALEDLPEAARDLLIERYLQGRTQDEVARRRGVNQSTVSRQISAALEQLRARLRARGLAAGGLAVVLASHAAEAAPAALMHSLGKMALSGLGAASAATSATLLTLTMSSFTTKAALTGVAVVLFAAAGFDLAGKDPWLLRWRQKSAATAKTPQAGGEPATATSDKNSALGKALASLPEVPTDAAGPGTVERPLPGAKDDSPPVLLGKLAALRRVADFRAFLAELVARKDPAFATQEIKRRLGLDMAGMVRKTTVGNATILEMTILTHLGHYHPAEALQWLATLEGDGHEITRHVLSTLLRQPEESLMSVKGIIKDPRNLDILKQRMESKHAQNVDIIRALLQGGLPEGPNRAYLENLLRATLDPVNEAGRLLASTTDTTERRKALASLAACWPKEQAAAGMDWALSNLSGNELGGFLQPMMSYLSKLSPDQAVALLDRMPDSSNLSTALHFSMSGLLQEHHRTNDVIRLVDKLEGSYRATAIKTLTREWMKVDPDATAAWLNQLQPADYNAGLPAMLPRLSAENYAQVMNDLMSDLNPGVEKALIRAARPDEASLPRGMATSTDIVNRLLRLPQYSTLAAGRTGNAGELWNAVVRSAEVWVRFGKGNPQEVAQWIDGLPFASPQDKAVVADKLYQQWKESAPGPAAQWAAGAGVKVN